MSTVTQTGFRDSKNHYEILDGLRGVAAIIVVIFHLFEAFAGGSHVKQIINHGYLAVDFFFCLSGFVIGYAYDDRWNKMSLGGFFKRRLIRLHPMIVLSMVLGAIGFYFSASPILFPYLAEVPLWKLILIMLIGCTLLPVPLSMDIRGWQEMHPINGPAWSLFFEYVANILYAFVLRKLSNKILSVLTVLAGIAVVHLAVTRGDMVGGWSLDPTQFQIGLTRLLYPFLAGLLLSRTVKPGRIRHAFLWSSFIIVLILCFPRLGGEEHFWLNGLYDSFAILFVFPFVICIGASGEIKEKHTAALCQFLGDVSYPLYITHYPLIYIFTAWVVDNHLSISEAWPVTVLSLFVSVLIGYASLKLYDIPVRRWLVDRFLK